MNDTRDVCDYIFKRVTVLYAGAAFQSVSDSRESNAILASDGRDDNSKLNELIFILRGIEYSNDTSQAKELKQRNEITKKCWSKAMEIYEKNRESVNAAVTYISLKIQRPNKKYTIKKVELLRLLIE
ncbi:TPA: hypothetical protein ACMDOB_001816 [Vibrio metschnikovii]